MGRMSLSHRAHVWCRGLIPQHCKKEPAISVDSVVLKTSLCFSSSEGLYATSPPQISNDCGYLVDTALSVHRVCSAFGIYQLFQLWKLFFSIVKVLLRTVTPRERAESCEWVLECSLLPSNCPRFQKSFRALELTTPRKETNPASVVPLETSEYSCVERRLRPWVEGWI